jgi:hypothetical protein
MQMALQMAEQAVTLQLASAELEGYAQGRRHS